MKYLAAIFLEVIALFPHFLLDLFEDTLEYYLRFLKVVIFDRNKLLENLRQVQVQAPFF